MSESSPSIAESPSDQLLGFLSATEIDGLGYCGGLLVLNLAGRPQEFHCTAPANPNRAQEILYGVTLRGWMVCDQIAAALVGKTEASLAALVVDDPLLLGLELFSETPVVAVVDPSTNLDSSVQSKQTSEKPELSCSGASPGTQPLEEPGLLPKWSSQSLAGQQSLSDFSRIENPSFTVVTRATSIGTLEHVLLRFSAALPLTEPFERISEAINEAHARAA